MFSQRFHFLFGLSLVCLVLAACAGATPSSTAASTTPQASPTPLQGHALVTALRQGGYIVFIRHTAIVETTAEHEPLPNYTDCSLQHPLSDKGRTQAQEIGEAFKRLNIHVGQVLNSLYCRCRDTAKIAFGHDQDSTDLLPPTAAHNDAERKQYRAGFLRLLGTVPSNGTNTVLVSHVNVGKEVKDIGRGDAAVFLPHGGSFTRVGTIRVKEWTKLQ